MKKHFNFSIAVMLVSLLISCAKDSSYSSNVTIAANYSAKPVPQTKIYCAPGNKPAVSLTPAQYREILTADGNGQATFYQLSPGLWYFYVSGYSADAGRTVQGDTVIRVLTRFRAESDFTVSLNMK